MTFRLHKLTFKNLLCFEGTHTVTFDKGFYALDAKIGKTAMIDIILYAIFGNSPRIATNCVTKIVNSGSKSIFTDVQFSVNNKDYRIIRPGKTIKKGAAFSYTEYYYEKLDSRWIHTTVNPIPSAFKEFVKSNLFTTSSMPYELSFSSQSPRKQSEWFSALFKLADKEKSPEEQCMYISDMINELLIELGTVITVSVKSSNKVSFFSRGYKCSLTSLSATEEYKLNLVMAHLLNLANGSTHILLMDAPFRMISPFPQKFVERLKKLYWMIILVTKDSFFEPLLDGLLTLKAIETKDEVCEDCADFGEDHLCACVEFDSYH